MAEVGEVIELGVGDRSAVQPQSRERLQAGEVDRTRTRHLGLLQPQFCQLVEPDEVSQARVGQARLAQRQARQRL